MALALSQVTTTPDAVKTQFDRTRDQEEVARLLSAGCAHMRKAFDIEDINLDELIATAMDDPQAMTSENKAFRGINFADLQTAYRQFCKNEKVPVPAVDLGEVIDHLQQGGRRSARSQQAQGPQAAGRQRRARPQGRTLRGGVRGEPAARNGCRSPTFRSTCRRRSSRPRTSASISHKGIDERGLIRAFIGNLAQSGRPQGGSTITQQIVKNLLVGEDLTYDRKIREMIVASRVEHTLSKAEILELYLNSVYLGRGSWGIELAARSYFGKPAKELTLEEGALLAGLTKGPNYFNPDRHPGRAQERLAYVFSRMQEDEANPAEQQAGRGLPALPAMVAYERPRRDIGFHFVDQVAREAKSVAGIEAITANSYTVRSTINPQLQRAVETTLQEGLSRYERSAGRVQFVSPEARLGQGRPARSRRSASPATSGRPGSRRWRPRGCRSTTCIGRPRSWWRSRGGKKNEAWRVGLADGRVLPLSDRQRRRAAQARALRRGLVRVTDGKGKAGARAELRVRPMVQGAVVVLENKTGRILAMSGGFSYPLSQLNRATQAMRQPGSAIKPLSYLAALGKGLQPNTLVRTSRSRCRRSAAAAPASRTTGRRRTTTAASGGTLTLRRALENSRNLATVHLLDGGIEKKPEASLDRLCDLAVEAQIYRECVRYYPFVLGAQPVRPIDLAAFYAAIANEGLRPTPYVDRLDRARWANDLSARSDSRRARSARSTAPRSTSSRP